MESHIINPVIHIILRIGLGDLKDPFCAMIVNVH